MQDLLDGFVVSLSGIDRKSQNTVLSYKRDIAHYIAYLKNNGVENISKTDRQTVITYLLFLKRCGRASSTISRNLASLRSFYMYVIDSGIIMNDPTVNLETPHASRKEPGVLTTAEVELLLNQPECGDAKGCRDKAMLELLYATGIKVSELINLRTDDINLKMGLLHCRTVAHERVVPIGHIAASAVENYLENARPNLAIDASIPFLFLNRNGMQLSRQGFWKIIKYYRKSTGIQKDITPYTLRHSFAIHLLENGADLEAIRQLLGHTDISATQVYSKMLDSRIKKVYENTHPRA
mgnify:CR=1 FL=1